MDDFQRRSLTGAGGVGLPCDRWFRPIWGLLMGMHLMAVFGPCTGGWERA